VVAQPQQAEQIDALEVALVEDAKGVLFGVADRRYQGLVSRGARDLL
jgi:hypothetical protein